MNKLGASAALLAICLLAAPLAPAQTATAEVTDMAALRAAMKADKRAFVQATLGLSDAEAKKFWPLYDAYQGVLDQTNRERNLVVVDLVTLDKPLSDAYARSLMKELLDADETELKARRKLQNGLVKALPPKKAARYLQLESKIRAAAEYDIATTIPLVK